MPGTNLTREEAATRATLVTVDTHDVELDVTGGPETFSTRSTIRFSVTDPSADTFLDFIGASVESITVNGTSLDPETHFADSRVLLTGLAEQNEVVVEATGRYTNSGEGLHRFVDPVDDEVYLYTQFEVPDSRRAFPVFEQPDLKAAFGFTVTAPAHWQVVSNSPPPSRRPGRRAWPPGASRAPRASPATSPPSSPAPTTWSATAWRPGAARCPSASSAARA